MNKKAEVSGILVLILLVGAFLAGHYIWKTSEPTQSQHYEFYTAFPHPIDSPSFDQTKLNQLCSSTSDPTFSCNAFVYEPYHMDSPDTLQTCYAKCSLSDGSIKGDFWLIKCSCYKNGNV